MRAKKKKHAVKSKKREEFSKAYIEYYPLLFNTVFTKVGSKENADDICQEVFLIFYEKFDEVENIRKWLFGTLRYAVLRYYEKNPGQDVDIDKIFDDVSLTYVNGFKDTRIIISEAIENVNLTEEERLILEYIAFNNYSYTNTGKIMGMTKRQIGYRYLDIVERIIEYLNEKGIEQIEDLL